jgi:hypothetical protein
MAAERYVTFVVNKDMAPWDRLAPIRHRERLLRKMNVAITQLRMAANYESAAAIAEALEVIRALPYGPINSTMAVAATPNYGRACAVTSGVGKPK